MTSLHYNSVNVNLSIRVYVISKNYFFADHCGAIFPEKNDGPFVDRERASSFEKTLLTLRSELHWTSTGRYLCRRSRFGWHQTWRFAARGHYKVEQRAHKWGSVPRWRPRTTGFRPQFLPRFCWWRGEKVLLASCFLSEYNESRLTQNKDEQDEEGEEVANKHCVNSLCEQFTGYLHKVT